MIAICYDQIGLTCHHCSLLLVFAVREDLAITPRE